MAMSENPGQGGGNFWTQKVAGVPMMVWGLLVVGGIVLFAYLRKKSGSGNTSSTAAQQATADETAASQVPQFVNQTYTSVYPPADNDSTGTTTGTFEPPTRPPIVTPPRPPEPNPKPPVKKKIGTLKPPANIHATKVTPSSITVAWDKVTGATGYSGHVTYQEPKSGKSGVMGSKSTSGTSMTFSGLGADHTYTVHIATRNSAGLGAESNGPAVKTSR